MAKDFGAGFHVAPGQEVDIAAYDQWTGRWSRLFVPAVLSAANVTPGARILDVSTGTGEAALLALPITGPSGCVVGADISAAMLRGARNRLGDPAFLAVGADGQALPFADGSFDSVVCHLGLQFFPEPRRGVAEFRRVLRPGGRAAVCVIAVPERAPMWGILADAVASRRPDLSDVLYLSFALGEPGQLEDLFSAAGFTDLSITQVTAEGVPQSFDDYWQPIEAGVGSIPQAYLALPVAERRRVRDEVRSQLARFEAGGKLRLSVEMLIASGRA